VMGKDKIMIPRDVDSAEKAVELVELLRNDVGAFKVGLELINAAGFEVFEKIKAVGAARVFYDCKLHDIPNTVAGAARAIARMGVWLFNVHCSGGLAMMKAAKEAVAEACAQAWTEPPKVIGVTLLTSIDQAMLNEELGVAGEVAEHVERMALLAKEAGLDGVVASPHEIELIRKACGPEFLIVTPGVRPAGAEIGDQKRVMTPRQAVERGADYLVIGRPITRADDPRAAARAIAEDL